MPVIDPKARHRRRFLTAEEIAARTPKVTAGECEGLPLVDTAEPQLVALSGSHYVEAIVTG